ncbi:17S U2 SnRNP complex component HTATSF1 isoform X2 [Chironomus tepperi]|uniref:17S U2 SnRNP complex component HTATSF1 isoform X2 n=1 Tax=Chironomus tepperi TaxID=113505 RepID=UPI00391F8C1F
MSDDENQDKMPSEESATKEEESIKVEEEPKAETSSKNVTYEDGVAIYTDEATKYKYKWCKDTNQWKPMENEHYNWDEVAQKWVPKASLENEYYRWCDKTNQWIPKMKQESGKGAGVYGYDEKEDCQIYTDDDGAVFFWDKLKKAWFPRVDDDFLALYQLNYGFVDNTSSTKKEDDDDKHKESVKSSEIEERQQTEGESSDAQQSLIGKKRKAPAAPPKWFEVAPENNTKVYVSNLPLDITETEFGDVMSKCGLVMKDLKTGKLKLKLYRDKNGEVKGDGLCHYIKVESVELALNVLDGYDVRGNQIKVERAEFQMRGEYNPALKPRVRKHEKEKMKKIQEKLFDWRPERMRGERGKHEKVVIIKNFFDPALFDREVHLIIDYQNDIRDECNKCGTVRKVIVYDRHPEGVVQVTMADPEEADLVIKLMNGRFFGERKLTAETWDGKTKYKIDESETDKTVRVQKWESFLETGEEAQKDITADEVKSTETETTSSSSTVEPVAEEQQQSESDNVETEMEAS